MTDLSDLLKNFRHSAWRLEARDTYAIGDEREQFEEFVATGHATPSDDDREFQAFIRGVRDSEREIGRTRLIGRPITVYTEFEFDYYPDLVAAGEEVRILDRADLAGYDGPWDTDFWIFDDETVAIMEYTEDGEYLGVRVLDNNGADVQQFFDARTLVVELSSALVDYTLPDSGRQRRRVA